MVGGFLWQQLGRSGASLLLGMVCWVPAIVHAQVTPDGTLPTVVDGDTVNGSTSVVITGGTQVGGNLFHSFQQFSIPTGGSAFFNNALTVDNIINRVTGGSPSSIDGLIRANGTANLFLLNPNGIYFGANAALNIGGSFFASTAPGLNFADGSVFSAVDPASLLLTVSVPIGPQGVSRLEATILSEGRLIVPQDLTLVGGTVTLGGELRAGGNVTLQAQDTLTIRDRPERPFLAVAGGSLVVAGQQRVDIFALNHGDSGLVAGGDLVLRSANPVIGDARYTARGNVRVEHPDGSLGSLISPNDPVIRSLGDVSFQAYEGASLHIYAAGSVTIPGYVWIQGVDGVNGIVETVTLSDGTIVAINGQTQPTLDIRAGMDPQVVIGTDPGAIGTIGNGSFLDDQPALTTPTLTTPPTSADIRIGNILFADAAVNPLAGTLLLTNRFQPNNALPGNALPGGTIAIGQVNAATNPGSGGRVTIDSRNDITTGNINLSAQVNTGGTVNLSALNDITTGAIVTTSTLANGGDISLTSSQGQVSTGNITTTSGTANSGNLVLLGRSVNLDNVLLDTQLLGTGNAGQVTIQASDVQLDNAVLNTSIAATGNGRGGNLQVTAETVTLRNGSQLRTEALGVGDTGTIAVSASNRMIVTDANSSITSRAQSGQGGAITLTTGTLQLANGGTVEASTASTAIGGAIVVNAQTVTIASGGQLRTTTSGSGAAGAITLGSATSPIDSITISNPNSFVLSSTSAGGATGAVTLTGTTINLADRAALSTNTTATGNAGNLSITAQNQLTVQSGGTISSSSTQVAAPAGSSGAITLTAPVIAIDAAQVTTSTAGDGRTGDITLQGSDRITIANTSLIRSQVSHSEATAQGGKLSITTPALTVNRSLLATETIGQGNGGNLTLQTGTLQIEDGGALQTSTAGAGNTGILSLTIADTATLTNQAQIRAIVDASATGNGQPVQITTPTLSLTGGAQILTSTSGNSTGSTVQVQAGTIALTDGSQIQSLVQSETGRGGDVNLRATNLALTNAAIVSVNRGGEQGGQITITTGNDLVLNNSQIQTATELGASNGTTDSRGGDVVLRGRSLQMGQTSQITTSITTAGQGGNLDIITNEPLRLSGGNAESPQLFLSSSTGNSDLPGAGGTIRLVVPALGLTNGAVISAATASSGDGGAIQISTRQLELTNGGQLRVSTSGAGDAGNLEIISRDRLLIDAPNTGIYSTTTPGATGDGGDITIDPDIVLLRNGATIAATTQGSGVGGNIALQAGSITLQNRAAITTETASGEGGNINIQLGDLLFMRDLSLISATSSAAGTGSNISFNGGYIIGFPIENSDIIALTNGGTGGTIQIAGQGVFGFTLQSSPSSISDVTTRSPVQFQGQSIIATLGDDPSKGFAELPDEVLDTSDQIVVGCAADRGNRFTIPGRGGLLPTPSEVLNRPPTLIDWGEEHGNEGAAVQGHNTTTMQKHAVPQVQEEHESVVQSSVDQDVPASQSVPASRWMRLSDGTIVLVGQGSLSHWHTSSLCPSQLEPKP